MNRDREAKSAAPRRDFLKLAGLGGVAAGAAALVGVRRAEATAVEEAPGRGGTGYRETEHVRRYYELARF
ncbi:MAG TPA: twin-arginine translocation signal domain-containing protein [Geminicoccaceae bacterium]|nr:twin-arginine translocation signal domain-containing protein [Geminicoccaceae bacterium]